jgi:C-methyltransferase C-terminal domain/Putative zinc binding domain/Methyltransferase domain
MASNSLHRQRKIGFVMTTNLTSCRFCGSALTQSFVDLGGSPLCESFRRSEQLDEVEHFYPLHPKVCGTCLLVQLPSFVPVEEIFREYAYYSSFSTSWLEHSERYVADISARLKLGEASFVCELASNDGYLLQYFVGKGPKILGVEPSYNCARDAEAKGVPTLTEFFGREIARQIRAEHGAADLILGNNVFAQVPDINDFVGGIADLLAPSGTVTLEWPHLLRLMHENQFDTIYHEHFGYFSLATTERIAAAHGLRVYDVEELDTHGGSLRVYLCHQGYDGVVSSPALAKVRADEERAGLLSLEGYLGFGLKVEKVKHDFLEFLINAKRAGKRVVGYGAPGKANTLLNYAGIRSDLIEFTVDRNPYKHGLFTPGAALPIRPPAALDEARPDYVVIMPWNLRTEIVAQLSYISEWGGKLVVAIPSLEIIEPGNTGTTGNK